MCWIRLRQQLVRMVTYLCKCALDFSTAHPVLANILTLMCFNLQLPLRDPVFIHSFISGTHHYEHVAPNVDIILQRGRFWAMSITLFRKRFNDSRSCWVVFIHEVWGRPGGLHQFSKREAVKICLACGSSGIRAMWSNRERRHAWTVAKRCGCSVFRLTSLFHTWWYHLIPNRHTIDREHQSCVHRSR